MESTYLTHTHPLSLIHTQDAPHAGGEPRIGEGGPKAPQAGHDAAVCADERPPDLGCEGGFEVAEEEAQHELSCVCVLCVCVLRVYVCVLRVCVFYVCVFVCVCSGVGEK